VSSAIGRMVSPRSTWADRPRQGALVGLLLAGALPAPAPAQSLDSACRAGPLAEQAECRLALATARAIQERIGIALWGGNPVPATASTVGMRIGATPRYSGALSLTMAPASLPPLLDRGARRGERVVIPGLAAHGTVGLLQGWSPVPTVGGVGSLDLVGRLSLARLPGGGFEQNVVVGWEAGARIGALRESFTMPGLSLTATYGRSTGITYGDPDGAGTDGFVRAPVSDLNATLAISRRISPVRVSGGVAYDRYTSRGRFGYPDAGGRGLARPARVTTDRQSLFAGGEWTFLIFHGSAEVGWQATSTPDDLPDRVTFEPSSWWGGLAFRISI
jgi:hypothetical protein